MPRRLLTVSPLVTYSTPFFCPTCGGDRLGSVTDGRRRMRLGRVAVAPWRRTTPHVSCTACGTAHDPQVLQTLTSDELADRLTDIVRVLTVMMVRAGDPTDRAIRRRAVQQVRTVVPQYHQNRLDRDLAQLDPALAAEHVAPLRDALAVEGKERLIVGMVQVALAAHTITPHQRWLLDTVGDNLGITPMHLTGIISAVAAAVEPVADEPSDRP